MGLAACFASGVKDFDTPKCHSLSEWWKAALFPNWPLRIFSSAQFVQILRNQHIWISRNLKKTDIDQSVDAYPGLWCFYHKVHLWRASVQNCTCRSESFNWRTGRFFSPRDAAPIYTQYTWLIVEFLTCTCIRISLITASIIFWPDCDICLTLLLHPPAFLCP